MTKIRRINFNEAGDELATLAAAEIDEKGALIVIGIDLLVSSPNNTEELNRAYNEVLTRIGRPWKAPQSINRFTHIRPNPKASQHGTFGALAMAQHTDLPELPSKQIPPVMATICVKQSSTPAPTTLVNLKGVWESIGEKTRRTLQREKHYFEEGSHGVHDPLVKRTNNGMIFRVTPAVLAQPELDEFRHAMSNPTFHTTFTLQEGEMLVVTNGTGAVPMTHGRGADPMSAKAGGQSSKKRHLIRGFLETVGPPVGAGH
jgi:hypothetical protein